MMNPQKWVVRAHKKKGVHVHPAEESSVTQCKEEGACCSSGKSGEIMHPVASAPDPLWDVVTPIRLQCRFTDVV